MRVYAESSKSVEGKSLIICRFERETPEAAAPIIEALYEVFIPEGLFTAVPPVLTLLSVTRQDTREALSLTPEERVHVASVAAEKAASMTADE